MTPRRKKSSSKWYSRAPLVLAAALTAVLVTRTLWFLFHAITNVPYTDQWLLLDEIRRFHDGALSSKYLWTPYWGQRIPVPRLLFLLDARLLHSANLPLILVGVAAQAALLVLLIRASRTLLCAVAFTHLLFSSLGMEVLAVPQNVQHSIGYACALAAILLFHRRPWLAIILGVLASGSLAAGLLVWPILILQAPPAPARVKVVLGVVSVLLVGLYAVGYTRPEMGMGLFGALRHPLQTVQMTALVLGGPITLYSLPLGTAAGFIGLLAAAYLTFRSRGPLALAACFLATAAFLLAAGRITPEWIAAQHGAQPLPSRYIAPVLIFWGCLLAVALQTRFPPATAIVGAIVLAMTFGTWSWQWRVSREWAVWMQKFDALASGFLVDVADPEQMQVFGADESLRSRVVEYLRTERLSMFAEPRANWVGRPVTALGFRPTVEACRASISITPAAGGGSRITGTLNVAGHRDLLLTDEASTVRGLARTLPAEAKNGFLGYLRTGATEHVELYVVLSGGGISACPLSLRP